MSIKAKRFKPYDTITSLSVIDMLNAKNDGPLNSPGPDKNSPTKELDNLQPKEFNLDDILPKISNAIDSLGKHRNPVDLTNKVLNELSKEISSIQALSKSTIQQITTDLNNELNKLLANRPASVFSNKGNPKKEAGCSTDVKPLMDILNDITDNAFSGNVNESAQIAGFTALFNRLACAGIPNAFTSLSELIESPETLSKVGATAIETARRLKSPEIIINVANSTIGGEIRKVAPNIINRAINSFKNTNTIKFSDFKSSLTILDPKWTGGINVNIKGGMISKEISTAARNELKRSIPVIRSSNVVRGLNRSEMVNIALTINDTSIKKLMRKK